MYQATKLLSSLWEGLGDRQKQIITGRFGLEKFSTPQTLAALGDRYDITRERVRQIESGTLELLRKKVAANSALTDILGRDTRFLKSVGGVIQQEQLLSHHRAFVEGLGENELDLLLVVTNSFSRYREDQAFHSFYYVDKEYLRKAFRFVEQFVKFLRPQKDEVLEGNYKELFKNFVRREHVEARDAENYVSISKKIAVNPYGDVGLAEWPEINPTTIRDRIYLVLKKQKSPLHFEDITKGINQAGFGGRMALVPTVHNELIKDSRFVLVGRGMYALSEYGYEPGTAKEVIERVLRNQGAMNPQDIVLAVQRERFFKPNTVLANLQNKNLFKRLEDGTYYVQES